MGSSGETTADRGSKVVGNEMHRRAPLPFRLTTFIGRDVQVGDLAGLLDDHRLVTVTGPGGCGKTRMGGRGPLTARGPPA